MLVIPIDIRMSQRSERGSQYWFFGLIAVLLGGGDDFHMVPRMIFLWTMGLKDYTVALSLGEWITSFFRKVHSNPPSSKVVTYTLYSGRKSSIPALGKPTKKLTTGVCIKTNRVCAASKFPSAYAPPNGQS